MPRNTSGKPVTPESNTVKAPESGRVRFNTTFGSSQYHTSPQAMLDHYNRDGKSFELRKSDSGATEMYHKGQKRVVGQFEDAPDK